MNGKMEDKIYYKTRCDGLWEECPQIAFAIYTLIYLVILFGSLFFPPIPGFLSTILLIGIAVFLLAKALLENQSKNMSKSTAFIERNGILYAIQLLYVNKLPGSKTNQMSTETTEDIPLYGNSERYRVRRAMMVQAHEQEVRSRRQDIESFREGLDDILEYLWIKPDAYRAIPDAEKSKLDWKFMYNIENAGMSYVRTKDASYHFLILHNPQIIEETEKYFKIRFLDEAGEVCTSKFTNCYDGLIEDIKYNSNFN